MADERMVPLEKPGELVNIAVTPKDFFGARVVRKDGAPIEAKPGSEHYMTYAEAGYHLTGYYEDKTLYEGPKTKRAYEREQADKRAERDAKRAEEAKAADAPKASAPKTDDKPVPAEAKKA